ncbi:MAG: hypothetical protein IE925_17075 [Rhodobacterales bacterium]|nr:hypothetical protein [Rhodobacterales bacterium]
MSFLTRTPVLWALFVLQILIGMGFGVFREAVGGTYLDFISSGTEARAVIDGMSASQKTVHFWVTVLLDTAYPLAYGGFLAGMALRFFGRFGKLAAAPALAVIVLDLTENMVQALGLTGTADVLAAKDWLTPLKFMLIWPAGLIALAALVIAILNMFRKKSA